MWVGYNQVHISHLVTFHSSLLTKTSYPLGYCPSCLAGAWQKCGSRRAARFSGTGARFGHAAAPHRDTVWAHIIPSHRPGRSRHTSQEVRSVAHSNQPSNRDKQKTKLWVWHGTLSLPLDRESEGLPPDRTLSPPAAMLPATALKSVLFLPGCPPSPASRHWSFS